MKTSSSVSSELKVHYNLSVLIQRNVFLRNINLQNFKLKATIIVSGQGPSNNSALCISLA
jgi:hypothetical protein